MMMMMMVMVMMIILMMVYFPATIVMMVLLLMMIITRCPSKPTREIENEDVLESHLMGLFGRHDFVKVVEERDIASCLC